MSQIIEKACNSVSCADNTACWLDSRIKQDIKAGTTNEQMDSLLSLYEEMAAKSGCVLNPFDVVLQMNVAKDARIAAMADTALQLTKQYNPAVMGFLVTDTLTGRKEIYHFVKGDDCGEYGGDYTLSLYNQLTDTGFTPNEHEAIDCFLRLSKTIRNLELDVTKIMYSDLADEFTRMREQNGCVLMAEIQEWAERA